MALETGIDAAEAWKAIRGNAKSLSINLPAYHSTLAAGGVTLEYVFSIYTAIRNSRNQLEALKATAGLNAYVQSVRGDPAYDAVAQITTVTDAQQAALNWIDTNASGLNLTGDSAENAIANNSVVTNRFTPAQTAALRAMLVSINDGIAG